MMTQSKGSGYDVAVIGGGLGGVAAALAAASLGARVVLVEETEWLGGQLTSAGVPLDEHPFIESFGCTATHRELRDGIRDYYLRKHPLTASSRRDRHLNPGMGWLSRLCAEPRIAESVIRELLAPYVSLGHLEVLTCHRAVAVDTIEDRVGAVEVCGLRTGRTRELKASFVLDATELGDVLELAGVEHVIGAEGVNDTEEPHATPNPNPLDQQAITWSFAMDWREGEDHTIERPPGYDRWSEYRPSFWPGPMFGWTDIDQTDMSVRRRPLFANDRKSILADDWWHYRRVLYTEHYEDPKPVSDVTLVNWPQHDYFARPLLAVAAEDRALAIQESKEVSLSWLYWMQTEAPRHDGDATGYPELRLRGDLFDTEHGLAKTYYVRESRRIVPRFRVLEQHISVEQRAKFGAAVKFPDSVGIGWFRLDLHPSTAGRSYIDFPVYPFQIPLGALIPVRVKNLLPAAKNIGTTHLTNGSYRFHHVEWNIGESAGALAVYCIRRGCTPEDVLDNPAELEEFQALLSGTLGIDLDWPAWDAVETRSHADPRGLWGTDEMLSDD